MERIGIIGLGYWGPNLVRNFQALLGPCAVWGFDRQRDRAADVARRHPGLIVVDDLDTLLANPQIDAVAVATPAQTHYTLARAALEAGKSVLVEKPLCTEAAQAEALIELARRRGKVLMVDHTFVYSPAVQKLRELVSTGQVGRVRFIDSVRINLGQVQPDVNVLWDLAPHDLSIADYLLGRSPQSVAAVGAAHTRSDVEDLAYLHLDYGDGLIGHVHVNWLSPVKLRSTLIGGSRRSIVYNDLEPVEQVKVYDCGVELRADDCEGRRQRLVDYRTGDVWSPHVAREEPLRRVAAEFVECCRVGRRPLADGEAGLRVVRVLAAAQRSIKAHGARMAL